MPLNSSNEKVGKLSEGKHKRLKSEFSLFKLNLFSDLRSNFNIESDEIFLKISNNIAAEVVVFPSEIIFTSVISS